MKNRVLQIIILTGICFFSCTGARKIITKPYNGGTVKPGIIYSLPYTTLCIEIKTIEKKYVPGIYAAYASSRLSLNNIPENEIVQNQIYEVFFSTHNIPDTTQYYLITGKRNMLPEIEKLTQNGLIFNLFTGNINQHNKIIINKQVAESVDSTDYAVIPGIVEKTDTVWKLIQKDTMQVRVPYLRKRTVNKTNDELLDDVTETIFNIRQTYVQLLTEPDNSFKDKEMLAYAVENLKKIEKTYLDLFTGENYLIIKSFLIPVDVRILQDRDSVVLGYFSEKNGFSTDKGIETVYLKIKNLSNTVPLKNLNAGKTKIAHALWIRIPEEYNLKIYCGKKILGETNIKFNQAGAIIPYPVF